MLLKWKPFKCKWHKPKKIVLNLASFKNELTIKLVSVLYLLQANKHFLFSCTWKSLSCSVSLKTNLRILVIPYWAKSKITWSWVKSLFLACGQVLLLGSILVI